MNSIELFGEVLLVLVFLMMIVGIAVAFSELADEDGERHKPY